MVRTITADEVLPELNRVTSSTLREYFKRAPLEAAIPVAQLPMFSIRVWGKEESFKDLPCPSLVLPEGKASSQSEQPGGAESESPQFTLIDLVLDS